jgi:hypothetical protein
MIKNIEIDVGRVSLYSTKGIQRTILVNEVELAIESEYGSAHLDLVDLVCMVTERPLQDSAAVGNLSGEDRCGNFR